MKTAFLCLTAWLALAAAGSAQQAWFVDPVAGSDGNGGQAQGNAFRSLTHALTQAAAGDNIFCLSGTYSADETFPIGLRNGVRVSSLAGTPVFDGQGAAVLFDVAENVNQTTELSGLALTDGVTLFRLLNKSAQGLRLSGCTFSDCTDGVDVAFNLNAGTQDLTITGCTFSATAGDEAISVALGAGTTLSAGGILGNQILGVFGTGVALVVNSSGVIAAGFKVERNSIASCTQGMALSAQGAGGNPLNLASLAATLNANHLTGSGGVGSIGLNLLAAVGSVGENARVSAGFNFNEVEGFATAVDVTSINDGNNTAEVIPEFYGNVLRGDGTGVRLSATLPNPLDRNADPNFGGNPDGGTACLNTFEGFTIDFDLAVNQTQNQFACYCWFDGAPVSQDGILRTVPIYDDPLRANAIGSVKADTADATLLVTAGNTTGFVDFDGAGDVGQIQVDVDGVTLDQSDIESSPLGASLTLTLPALAEGRHTLTVTNPGGQSGDFDFQAALDGQGAGTQGCFVATAAHGDYDAPEVRALRGLRDEYLSMSGPGRGFIRWYYREGPKAAAWIAARPWARAGARVALQPAVWTARALTGWNAAERFACGLLLLGASFALLRRRLA